VTITDSITTGISLVLFDDNDDDDNDDGGHDDDWFITCVQYFLFLCLVLCYLAFVMTITDSVTT